jgi:hypothetical protein
MSNLHTAGNPPAELARLFLPVGTDCLGATIGQWRDRHHDLTIEYGATVSHWQREFTIPVNHPGAGGGSHPRVWIAGVQHGDGKALYNVSVRRHAEPILYGAVHVAREYAAAVALAVELAAQYQESSDNRTAVGR